MELNNALAVIDLKGYFVPHISIDNDFRIISRENYTVSMKIENGITDINEIQRNETTGHLEAHLILDLTVTAVSNDDNEYSIDIYECDSEETAIAECEKMNRTNQDKNLKFITIEYTVTEDSLESM